jgi:hypothetical protein
MPSFHYREYEVELEPVSKFSRPMQRDLCQMGAMARNRTVTLYGTSVRAQDVAGSRPQCVVANCMFISANRSCGSATPSTTDYFGTCTATAAAYVVTRTPIALRSLQWRTHFLPVRCQTIQEMQGLAIRQAHAIRTHRRRRPRFCRASH